MPPAPGTRLGPYEILASVGAGGMGEVWKARDTRLERTVAVKVSKEAFGERFRDEAKAVAALNHRHVCTLFDVGPDYLVMEYVDGKPLRGPLPVAEALRLAGQIADALEHAHRHGIIHRDLKPSNILVAKGSVKVLDFGLAKRLSPTLAGDESHSTISEDRALLGTPRYMAPEQIDGQKADERTDIFAFGLVLYEMLTGQRAFDGKSAAGVMAAVLEKDPRPISALKPETPPAVEQVVQTCLAKDPAERWQSMRELKHALAWAAQAAPIAHPRARRGRTVAAVVAAALLGVGGGLALKQAATPSKPLPVRFQIALPQNARLPLFAGMAVSPDGRRIALPLTVDDTRRLYLRPLDAVDLAPVPGSEGAAMPFWSPDGRQIAFGSGRESLRRIDLAGGPPQTVCKLPGFLEGASWGSGDVILFSARGKLFRVPARGGEAEPVGRLAEGEIGRGMPFFLPDGRHYLYLSLTPRAEDRAIYVGALDSDLRKRVVTSGYDAAYSPSGHLLFVRGDALMAQPFDAERLALSGEPLPVIEQVALGGFPSVGDALFSVSATGVLAWQPGPLRDLTQLHWLDRTGRKLGTLGEPAVYFHPVLSPDERSLAVCRSEPVTNVRDLWVFDVAGGTSRRLTFDAADNCGQAWSPDGARLAFFSNRRGVREIYQKPVNGSGDDELLLASKDEPLHVEDWSPDGRFLVYNSPGPSNASDLFLLPMSGADRKPVPFLASEFVEQAGTFSPNSRWIAYWSQESGRREVYVKGLSPRGVAEPGKWQVSKDGGTAPRWRRDGQELFYVSGSRIMAVDVTTGGPAFAAGSPKPLFEVPPWEPADRPFDVTRDGHRFVVNVPVKPREPIRVLVNWRP